MELFNSKYNKLFNTADMYLRNGDLEKLRGLLNKLSKEKLNINEKSFLYYIKGQMFITLGKYRSAAKMFKKSRRFIQTSSMPSNSQLYLDGACLFELLELYLYNENSHGYLILAIDKFKSLNSKYPDFEPFGVLYYLGRLYHLNNDFEMALQALHSAIDHSDDDNEIGWAMEEIGSIYFTIEDFNSSIIYFNKVLNLINKDWFYYKTSIILGQAYYIQGDLLSSEKLLKNVEENIHNYPILTSSKENLNLLYAYLGFIEYNNSNFKKAIEYLIKAIHFDNFGDSLTIHYLFPLSESFQKIGKFNDAIYYFKMITESPLASIEEKSTASRRIVELENRITANKLNTVRMH